MFIDKVKVRARAGDGGNGCVSFRREKYVQRGGPDGGMGGDGGDIILVADKNTADLTDHFYAPRLISERGQHGRGKNCSGRCAKPVIVRVPVGTQVYRLGAVTRAAKATTYRPAAAVYDQEIATATSEPRKRRGKSAGRDKAESDETRSAATVAPTTENPQTEPLAAEFPTAEPERVLIADLIEDGQQFVLAHGGKGGRGNFSFKTSLLQAPREFEYGEPGEELAAELELKTLADVGLVGFPNAGKSTLISKLTHAHPKIAPYPFTTKTPKVGVITYDDFQRIRVADIPGLIEGAHAGKGLGHDFLRHIERCRLLVILLDMAGVDGRKPQADYRQLLGELAAHDPALMGKPRVVVANKMDLAAAKKNLTAFKRLRGLPPILKISALADDGLDELKRVLRETLLQAAP